MNKSVKIATAAALAAAYAALVQVLHPISFLAVQVRVANALIGFVPLLGMPAVYGITIGVFLANLSSPLGPIDWFSFIPTFVGLVAVHKLRDVSVLAGLLVYSVILGAWVAFILWYVLNIPYVLAFAYVTTGIAIATAGLGYMVYRAASRIRMGWWA